MSAAVAVPDAVGTIGSTGPQGFAASDDKFIPSIAEGLRLVQTHGSDIHTSDFVGLVDRIIRVFDYLGPVLMFAKQDMHAKAESLRHAVDKFRTLKELVAADRAAGIISQKNSRARNLHRLTAVLQFMRLLLTKLVEAPTASVKDAATYAYQEALAPIHPYAVRTAVWAGMYMLPTREGFLHSIGETEDSARGPAIAFSLGAQDVEKAVLALYDAPMPASVAVPGGMLGSWWGTAPAPAPS